MTPVAGSLEAAASDVPPSSRSRRFNPLPLIASAFMCSTRNAPGERIGSVRGRSLHRRTIDIRLIGSHARPDSKPLRGLWEILARIPSRRLFQMPTGSGQRRAKPAGCHPSRPAENLRQMALVAEPGFERYRGQRLAGAPHQGLGPFDPPLHDVTLRADTGRLLERPVEMVRARQAMSASTVSERSSSRCASM